MAFREISPERGLPFSLPHVGSTPLLSCQGRESISSRFVQNLIKVGTETPQESEMSTKKTCKTYAALKNSSWECFEAILGVSGGLLKVLDWIWKAFGGCQKGLWRVWEVLGRDLGGSWAVLGGAGRGLGTLLEGSWSHLGGQGPETTGLSRFLDS